MSVRTITGFIIAPLAIPLVLLVCNVLAPSLFTIGPRSSFSYLLQQGLRIGIIGLAFGYCVTAVGAAPLHLYFTRRGWTRWWMYVLLGAILGCAPWLIFGILRLLDYHPGTTYPAEAFAVLIGLGIACGAPAAGLFWIIAVRR
jgi:hypothetical protein